MQKYKEYLDSKIGLLEIVCNQLSLEEINFVNKEDFSNPNEISKKTIIQLNEYFNLSRKVFDIPLYLNGTDFQIKVWEELQKIPYGTTVSYKYIAESINNSKSVRAVGMANSKNKIPIIIPCHRVISSDGKISGYSGGVHIKRKLLEIENINI